MAVTATRTNLSYDDYVRFPDDGRTHEIIDGVHYVGAGPFLDHQLVSSRMHFQLFQQIVLSGKGEVFHAPTAVQLSPNDIVQPDMMVVLADHRSYLTASKVDGPPDLVVEILSSSSRRTDREQKLLLYERTGVDEYWIVDVESRQVEQYRREGDSLAAAGVFDARIGFDALPGVVIDLRAVWLDIPLRPTSR